MLAPVVPVAEELSNVVVVVPKNPSASHFAYWLGRFAAFCTALHSIRLTALYFLSEPNGAELVDLSRQSSQNCGSAPKLP